MKALLLLPTVILGSWGAIWDIELGPEALVRVESGPRLFGIHSGNNRQGSNGTGLGDETGSIRYNDQTKEMQIEIAWGTAVTGNPADNIDVYGGVTAVSIRGPANLNTSAPALYTFSRGHPGIQNLGFDYESGSFNHTFALQDNPNGSGFNVLQQQSHLLGDKWYLTIDSLDNAEGEITGHLTVIPEPIDTGLISAVGLLVFMGFRRYRHCSI